ncbi:MAG: AbrB/MazE/SpoVT family DNA-binding domain-containing protein [Candidatus Nanoarchaeia archaeon]|jgi:AbrB family looped-hinge helix DNA binding protein
MNFDFYNFTKVGSRGQISLSAEAREDFGIKSGDYVSLAFIKECRGIFIFKSEQPEFMKKISTIYEKNKVQDSGQIVLPKKLRQEHNIFEGDKFLVLKKKHDSLLLIDFNSFKEKITGILKKIEEIKE